MTVTLCWGTAPKSYQNARNFSFGVCLKAALQVEVCLCFYNPSCIDENVKRVEKGQ